jgi:hypothetical protein
VLHASTPDISLRLFAGPALEMPAAESASGGCWRAVSLLLGALLIWPKISYHRFEVNDRSAGLP